MAGVTVIVSCCATASRARPRARPRRVADRRSGTASYPIAGSQSRDPEMRHGRKSKSQRAVTIAPDELLRKKLRPRDLHTNLVTADRRHSGKPEPHDISAECKQ